MQRKDSFVVVRKLFRHPDLAISFTRFFKKIVWKKRKRLTDEIGAITHAMFVTEYGKFSDVLLIEFAISNPGVELQMLRRNANEGPLMAIHRNGRKKMRFATGLFEKEGKLCCKNRHGSVMELAEFI